MTSEKFELLLPSSIIFGEGSVSEIGTNVKNLGTKSCMLITSHGMRSRECFRRISQLLIEQQIEVTAFSRVEPEPSMESVYDCIAVARDKTDVVIGLGGGSVMDVAKKVAADLRLPKIMIATTSGTGSEVTHESVLKVNGKKKAFVSKNLLPDIAIVDPELSMSMPPELTAATGLDALAHAVECYESRRSNHIVRTIADNAFEVLKQNFSKAVAGNKEARIRMSLGSLMAGMAFGNSGTALGHALSYPFSSRGIPHGKAVAVVLPYALEYNNANQTLIDEVNEVTGTIAFEWNNNWDIQEMTAEVMEDTRHLSNNPRYVDRREVLRIFRLLEEKYGK